MALGSVILFGVGYRWMGTIYVFGVCRYGLFIRAV